VLCAALGRAVGLPTRCVVGFGYIPPGEAQPTIASATDSKTGIFGFHMWAEAWIGPDRWMAMDAALDGFDVGHIAITKSALEEVSPVVDLNMPVIQLMESLKIEIVKTVAKRDMPAPRGPRPLRKRKLPGSIARAFDAGCSTTRARFRSPRPAAAGLRNQGRYYLNFASNLSLVSRQARSRLISAPLETSAKDSLSSIRHPERRRAVRFLCQLSARRA